MREFLFLPSTRHTTLISSSPYVVDFSSRAAHETGVSRGASDGGQGGLAASSRPQRRRYG